MTVSRRVQRSVTLSPPLAAPSSHVLPQVLTRPCDRGGEQSQVLTFPSVSGCRARRCTEVCQDRASDPSTKNLIRSTNKEPGKTK